MSEAIWGPGGGVGGGGKGMSVSAATARAPPAPAVDASPPPLARSTHDRGFVDLRGPLVGGLKIGRVVHGAFGLELFRLVEAGELGRERGEGVVGPRSRSLPPPRALSLPSAHRRSPPRRATFVLTLASRADTRNSSSAASGASHFLVAVMFLAASCFEGGNERFSPRIGHSPPLPLAAPLFCPPWRRAGPT